MGLSDQQHCWFCINWWWPLFQPTTWR